MKHMKCYIDEVNTKKSNLILCEDIREKDIHENDMERNPGKIRSSSLNLRFLILRIVVRFIPVLDLHSNYFVFDTFKSL